MYIRSSKLKRNNGRRIVAEEEVQTAPAAEIAPEATELVFETEDVAELVAEITGEDVEVTADENEVTFTVGDTDFTVEAEGGEEVLEASTSVRRRNAIRANNTRANARRPVAASRNTEVRRNPARNPRVIRKSPNAR